MRAVNARRELYDLFVANVASCRSTTVDPEPANVQAAFVACLTLDARGAVCIGCSGYLGRLRTPTSVTGPRR